MPPRGETTTDFDAVVDVVELKCQPEKIDLFITVGEDYRGREPDELHVRKGQVLRYLEQKGTWVLAADVRGKAGYLPAACCRLAAKGDECPSPAGGEFNSHGIAAYLRAERARLNRGYAKTPLGGRLSLKESLTQRIEPIRNAHQPNSVDNADGQQHQPQQQQQQQQQQQMAPPAGPGSSKCSSLQRLFHISNKSKLSVFRRTCRKAASKTMKICKVDGGRSSTYRTGELPTKLEARSPTTSGDRALPLQPTTGETPVESSVPSEAETSQRNTFASCRRAGLSTGRNRKGHSVSFCESVITPHAPHAPRPRLGPIDYVEELIYSPRNASVLAEEEAEEVDGDGLYENCREVDIDRAVMQYQKSRPSPLEPSECSIVPQPPCKSRLRPRPTSAKPKLPRCVTLYHSAPTTRCASPEAGGGWFRRTDQRQSEPIVGSLDYFQDDSNDPLAADMSTFRHSPEPVETSSSAAHPLPVAQRFERASSRDTKGREFAQRSFSNELEYRPTHLRASCRVSSNLQSKNGHSVVGRTSSVPAVLQPTFIALFDFPSTQKPLLSVKTGDVLQLCLPDSTGSNSVWCGHARGWKYVTSPHTGEVGYVPAEILRPYRSGNVNGISTTYL